MTGLSAGTTYYVRSYATNSAGTGYGAQVSFTSLHVGITANITSELASSNPVSYVIVWTVTLSSPAVNNMVIPCITTNGSNTGTTTVNVSFSARQPTSGANAVEYIRQPGTNFTAYCTFGTMPAGYAAGSTSSYLIPMPVVVIPTLGSTTAVTSITQTTATSGGNITSDGGATVTEKGICWSTSQNPTTANSKAAAGSGTGSFPASMTGLSAGTTYYVRSYATNSAGTGYGAQVSFTTLPVGITASISYQVFSTQPTSIVVGWFANLTSPAPSYNSIPCIITNSNGSGTHTSTGTVAQGQQSSIVLETVTYSRLAGSNYNATCTFGTMPTGYVAGATGVVTIPKQ